MKKYIIFTFITLAGLSTGLTQQPASSAAITPVDELAGMGLVQKRIIKGLKEDIATSETDLQPSLALPSYSTLTGRVLPPVM